MATVNGAMTVTKNPARCLNLYPRPVWEQVEQKMAGWPMSADPWRRVYLGSATDVDVDGASRVLIPPELRQWAGLEREVVFMGMGPYFELWDRAAYERAESAALEQGLPDVLKDMVLR
jgi:MraZ protein